MAEYNENQIRFGWLNYDEMIEAIQNGDLNEYDICFTKDTHEEFLINSKLQPIAIKSRLRIYSSVEAATADINETSSQTYPGEIISIRDGEKFIAYVVNELDGEFFVTPVYADRMIDYDGLTNIPIKNVKGTIENPIILTNLEDGFYEVKGNFVTPDEKNINSIVGNTVLIETVVGGKQIKRFNSNNIIDYYIDNENNVTLNSYVTEKYLSDKGYATEEYVDIKIAALEEVLKQYVQSYVESTVELLVIHIVNEVLDSRYSSNEDIENLFH